MMKIESRFVETALRSFVCDIGWRETMNYAAAVQDENPRYFDDQRPDGIVAPPMFCVAATWPIIGCINEFIDSADFPRELLLTQVHYTEHLRFYRLLRPGDRLAVDGRIAAIMPHRAGTHIVIRLDGTDGAGNPVFTEHTGALLRGVTCVDAGAGQNKVPKTPVADFSGKPVWESVVDIEPLRPFIYDGCTDIVFPIHTSRRFARQVGLPGIILQGTATMAYAARELVNREMQADPEQLTVLSGNFTGMVQPGTQIRIQLLGRRRSGEGMDLFFRVVNLDDQNVISRGYACVKTG